MGQVVDVEGCGVCGGFGVKCGVADLYAIEPSPLKEGKWQLLAEWRQVSRTLSIKNCGLGTDTFDNHFYAQENLPLTIQVTSAATTKRRGPSPDKSHCRTLRPLSDTGVDRF